jgi:hypothetical protein
MAMFLIRLPHRSRDPSPRKKPDCPVESQHQIQQRRQVIEHLREVRANYRLERRSFLS